YCLAVLGQHLDLVAIWRANHSNKTGALDDAMPTSLGEMQPLSTTFVGCPQALALKPSVDLIPNGVQTLGTRATRCLCYQHIEFVNRNAAHESPSTQVDNV